MPGFGDGPFGAMPFGRWSWGHHVLYDYLPGQYRNGDADNGYTLLAWSLAAAVPLDGVRARIQQLDTLRDPLSARTQYNERVSLRLGRLLIGKGSIEQRGVDGSVSAAGEFTSPTLRLSFSDQSKVIRIKNSLAGNTGEHAVAQVTSPTTLITADALNTEAGPLRWELEGVPDTDADVLTVEVRAGALDALAAGWTLTDGVRNFEVVARRKYTRSTVLAAILNDRQGEDGATDDLGRLFSTAAAFTADDAGKKMVVASSAEAIDGEFAEIEQVVSGSLVSFRTLRVDGPAGSTYESSVGYVSLGRTDVTLQQVNNGPSLPLVVSVLGGDITVQLATDALGTPTSTAADVVLAVRTSTPAFELVRVMAWTTGVGVAGVGGGPVPVRVFAPADGPLFWSLAKHEQLDIRVVSPPGGLTEQTGVDGSITAPGSFAAPSANFQPGDAGKLLVLLDSVRPESAGPFRVSSAPTPGILLLTQLDGTPTALQVEAGPLRWELRTASGLADVQRVECYPEPMLPYLGTDFAAEVDQYENETTERAWVRNASQWIQHTGGAEGYTYVAKLSGFSVELHRLFRIDPWVAGVAPAANVFEVGEEGGIGLDGSFGTVQDPVTLVWQTTFTAPSFTFQAHDVDKLVRVRDAANPANNRLFYIDAVLSAHVVRFRWTDQAALPEANSGTLRWALVRLYTDLPPRRPRFDEVVEATLSDIVTTEFPGKVFGVDRFCWEAEFKAEVPASYSTITAVAVLAVTRRRVTYTWTGPGPVVASVGQWSLVDSSGAVYWLDTVPVETVPGTWTFEITSRRSPALGPMVLRYNCPDVPSCDYCPSNKILLKFSPESVDTGIEAAADVYDRILRRLTLPKPIHVELIAVLVQELAAGFDLDATIEPHGDIGAILLAPFSPNFDEIPGDDIPLDDGIIATIDPTLP